MAAYFLDSSALVKRYVTETGTGWITALLDPATRNRIYVARITGAEVVSALIRKRRGGHLSAADATVAVTRFRHDFNNPFRVVEIGPALVAEAMTLAENHALRGYDAVQLAAAMEAQRRRAARGRSALTLISADGDLTAAGAVEGLITDDPNMH